MLIMHVGSLQGLALGLLVVESKRAENSPHDDPPMPKQGTQVQAFEDEVELQSVLDLLLKQVEPCTARLSESDEGGHVLVLW